MEAWGTLGAALAPLWEVLEGLGSRTRSTCFLMDYQGGSRILRTKTVGGDLHSLVALTSYHRSAIAGLLLLISSCWTGGKPIADK